MLLYYDYLSHFNFLTDEQLGKIVRAMLDYEINGVLPEFSEPIMQMTFSFVRSNLDRDREKFIERCQKNAENGKKGGRPSKTDNFDSSQSDNIRPDYQSDVDDTDAKKKAIKDRMKNDPDWNQYL